MFSVLSLTSTAISAILLIPSAVNSICNPSVVMSSQCCLVSEALGSVRILSRSPTSSAFSSTLIGSRPCSSGIRSDGLDKWKAPDAIKRIWSVLIMPNFVETVQPSINGRRSRCTPSLETSAPLVSPRLQTLSISSRNTIPFCSAASTAILLISSSLTSLAASSSLRCLRASATVTFLFVVFSLPMLLNMFCN